MPYPLFKNWLFPIGYRPFPIDFSRNQDLPANPIEGGDINFFGGCLQAIGWGVEGRGLRSHLNIYIYIYMYVYMYIFIYIYLCS